VCKRQRAFLHHLDIALGSEGELEVQLEIAQRLGFAAQKDIEAVANRVADVGRMLNGLIEALPYSIHLTGSTLPCRGTPPVRRPSRSSMPAAACSKNR